MSRTPATSTPATCTLDLLKPGARARVLAVAGDGAVRRRLLEMGLCGGVEILAERRAPFGDPVEYRVRGYCLSLRQAQAKLVQVVPVGR